MKTMGMLFAVVAVGLSGCQKEEKAAAGKAAPEAVVEKAVEQPATPSAVEQPAEQKPKDHPAH